MYSNSLCLILIVCFTSFSYGQRQIKYFRKDYTFIESTESFYKIHTIHRTWAEAKRVCAQEGATFFYPENEEEAHTFLTFWNETQPFSWVFVGISDLVAKGVYETIDGLPVTDVYCNWGPGEPNDANGKEDCVIMRRDGTLNDDNCFHKYPFVCKKSLASLEWNLDCDSPYLDYKLNRELGRCYKFHTKPLNWTDAYGVCSAELSYLAVINSPLEAQYLVQLTASTQKDHIIGNYMRGAILLGFHNRIGDGWQTVRGLSLEDSGYIYWSHNQPDGGDREQCGSMFFNGQLNDIGCEQKGFFICEHDIASLSSQIDDRFGS